MTNKTLIISATTFHQVRVNPNTTVEYLLLWNCHNMTAWWFLVFFTWVPFVLGAFLFLWFVFDPGELIIFCAMSIYSGSSKSISGDIRERIANSQKQCLEFWNRSSWATHWAEEPWQPPSKGREELSEVEPTLSSWWLSTLIDNGSSPKRPLPCQSSPNSGRYCPKMSSDGPLRKTHHENHCGASQNHSRHEVFLPVSSARAGSSCWKTDVKIA